jgi:hypothetical protein
LPAWIKEGYATEKDRNNYMKRWFYCKFQPQLFKTKDRF